MQSSRYIQDQFSKISGVKNWELMLSMGEIRGFTTVDKFGENPSIDSGDSADIWEGGGEYSWDMAGTDPIRSLISDSSADDGLPIEVYGLDINGFEVSQTIILGDVAREPLKINLWRVYRMINVGDRDIEGTVYCYVGSGGVPSLEDTRAIINNGNNQTLMALYTVPLGKVGFLYRGELGVSRPQTSGAVRCAYYSRRRGKVFTIKKRVDLSNSGSSIYQDSRSFPDVIPALTDIKLRVEESTANGTGVFGTFDIMLVDEEYLSPEFLISIAQPSAPTGGDFSSIDFNATDFKTA